MRDWFRRFAVACALAVAAPAAAQPYQIILNFDDLPVGSGVPTFNAFGDPLFGNTISGGIVAAATPGDPAVSGSHIFRGTKIGFTLSDPFNYCWPAIGAFVTGTAPITLTLLEYNPETGEEEVAFVTSVGGGTTNFYLSGGDIVPGTFTSGWFTSTAEFSMDDLTLGLVDVPYGIPEPATWGLLIGGFAISGAALRGRRVRAGGRA